MHGGAGDGAGAKAGARKPHAVSGAGAKSKKKKTPEKAKSNGKEAATAPQAGSAPAPAETPTLPPGSAWGKPNRLVGSAPPGFGAAPPPPRNGFSDEHQRLLRHRALFAFRFLVGKAVDVQLADSTRYVGILDCIDPDDFSVVLKSTKRVSESSEPFESGCTVIFKRSQLAHLSAEGVVNYTEGAFPGSAAAATGFRTDTEISGRQPDHLFGRELQAASSWLDPSLDTGELEDTSRRRSSKGSWNQFEANEKLFGVKSTFDENLYTTKLDREKLSLEQSREAERIAKEIERQTSSNFHLQEERGQKLQHDMDEEALYSSVDRKDGSPSSAASRGQNAYVPPALRNAQRQSSGGPKGKAEAPAVPAKPVSPTAKPASAPKPATPSKPLSFSEAVTGRSVPSAAAPAAQPEAKDSAKKSASPKKSAAPTPSNGKESNKESKKASRESAKPSDSTSKSDETTASGKTDHAKEPSAKKAKEGKSDKKSDAPATAASDAKAESKSPAGGAAPKKGLNPNAKEFKLNASAAEFTPKFTPPAAAAYPGNMYQQQPYQQMGMPYPQEEWVYDGMGEEGGDPMMAPYMGYGMPMAPNMMPQPMYPPMMPQQNVRMGGGHRQHGGYHGGNYPQQPYNQRGYYAQNGGYSGGMGYQGGRMPDGSGPQPPLPREPSPGDDAHGAADASEQTPTPQNASQQPPEQQTPDQPGSSSPTKGSKPAKAPKPAAKKVNALTDSSIKSACQSLAAPRRRVAMLPPISRPAINGASNQSLTASSSGSFGPNDSFGEPNRRSGQHRAPPTKDAALPDHSLELDSGGGAASRYVLDKLRSLERENEQFREELLHLRHRLSSNQQQREEEKLSLSKVVEDLQRLAHSFNSKLQADATYQQREQQKAALLFAEVSRLGLSVDKADGAMKLLADDTRRKLELQEQQTQYLASSVASKPQQTTQSSPTRGSESAKRQLDEMHHELQLLQNTTAQLRQDVDSDRNDRWRADNERGQLITDVRNALAASEAAVDGKVAAQLERVHGKLAGDKMEVMRVLDEYRQVVTGADLKRLSNQMAEFTRINDHMLDIERWLHGEFGTVKRIVQAMAADVDGRFQAVLQGVTTAMNAWMALSAQTDEELRVRVDDLHDAVAEATTRMQKKAVALEDVLPLEVKARQQGDDKLRRRVEGVVKSLTRALEATRDESIPPLGALRQRIAQLEAALGVAVEQADIKHNSLKQAMKASANDPDIDQRLSQLEDALQSGVLAADSKQHELKELQAALQSGLTQVNVKHEDLKHLEAGLESSLAQVDTKYEDLRQFVAAFVGESESKMAKIVDERAAMFVCESESKLARIVDERAAALAGESESKLAQLVDERVQDRIKQLPPVRDSSSATDDGDIVDPKPSNVVIEASPPTPETVVRVEEANATPTTEMDAESPPLEDTNDDEPALSSSIDETPSAIPTTPVATSEEAIAALEERCRAECLAAVSAKLETTVVELLTETSDRHSEVLAAVEDVDHRQQRTGASVSALQTWTAAHARECRDVYEYVTWAIEAAREDAEVRRCVQAVVDLVADSNATDRVCSLEMAVHSLRWSLQSVDVTELPDDGDAGVLEL